MADKRKESYRHVNICLLIFCAHVLVGESLPQKESRKTGPSIKDSVPCSKFQFEGYHCLPEERCGFDYYEISDSISVAEIRSAEKELFKNSINQDFDPSQYTCELDTDVCCRKPEYYGKPEPVIRDLVESEYCCQDYRNYGYECVEECGEDGYYEGDTQSESLVPRSLISFAKKMSCQSVANSCSEPRSSSVCCRKASFFSSPEPEELGSSPNECTKWRQDGFQCIDESMCLDDHFVVRSNQGSVPNIRGDYDYFEDISEPRSATCTDPGKVCCRNARYFDLPLSSDDTADLRTDVFDRSQCGYHIDYEYDAADLRADRRPADITLYSNNGEWPHMCTIFKKKSSNLNGKSSCSRTLEYVCGASLISSNAVLTSWHNIRNIPTEDIVVKCGEWSMDTTEDRTSQKRCAKSVHHHPNAKFGQKRVPENDLSIIKVGEDFYLDEYVNTICLPNSVDDYFLNDCYATGFGRDNWDSKSEKSRVLKKILMDVEPDHSNCEKAMQNAIKPGRRIPTLGKNFRLHPSFVCAGGYSDLLGHQDTCTGDGGSPLVCPSKTVIGDYQPYFQVGIVSWGIGCKNGNPGVYTNVTAAVDFINSIISKG